MTSTTMISASSGEVGTGTGREYLRVSLDRSGRARSIEEQHAENDAAATARGTSLGDPYVDKSVSASRYSRKARDGFVQLITDLESGQFGATELFLWESSRGSRRVGEWVTLIELCELRGVQIFVTTHNRSYDPSNGRDRRSLLEDAVDSEYESSKISTRLKRAHAASAAEGKPHGKVPYGYRRIYDERTRKLIVQEPDPVEAPVIKELFDRVKAGHSFHGIARDFEERGIRTRTGKPFAPQHLRVLATTATYAGLRVHDTNGRQHSHSPQTDTAGVQVVKGTWEPLITEATWHAVQRILRDPRRTTTKPGGAKHLLSNIAVCDVCGGPIFARPGVDKRHAVPSYQCRKGHVRIPKADLEECAEFIMLGWLSSDTVHAAIRAAEVDTAELQGVRDQLASARARLAALADAVAVGSITITLAARAEPQIQAEITELERRDRELTSPPALQDLITPGAQVEAQWSTMPMSARREVARLLLSPAVIGQLRIRQVKGPRRVPAADRIRLRTD